MDAIVALHGKLPVIGEVEVVRAAHVRSGDVLAWADAEHAPERPVIVKAVEREDDFGLAIVHFAGTDARPMAIPADALCEVVRGEEVRP